MRNRAMVAWSAFILLFGGCGGPEVRSNRDVTLQKFVDQDLSVGMDDRAVRALLAGREYIVYAEGPIAATDPPNSLLLDEDFATPVWAKLKLTSGRFLIAAQRNGTFMDYGCFIFDESGVLRLKYFQRVE